MRRIASYFGDPRSYGAELDTQRDVEMVWSPELHCYVSKLPLSFAHVLNVQPTEEGWLADATELFLPEFFATRYDADDVVYKHRGGVWDHMREELYRLSCTPEQVTHESYYESEFMLSCFEFSGGYAKELFAEPLPDPFSDEWFSEDEEDTLNSELLLTEECYTPDACQQESSSLAPRRRVNMFSPTERKDK